VTRRGDATVAGAWTSELTGWTAGNGNRQLIMFPELAEERDVAEHVKRDAEILVVPGNPPYNGYAGLAMDASERAVVAEAWEVWPVVG